MTKIPVNLQDLRRSLYIKAKAEPAWRFWGLYVHVCKSLLLEKVARRVQDDDVMRLLKMILKATGKKGVPQGGVITPLTQKVTLIIWEGVKKIV